MRAFWISTAVAVALAAPVAAQEGSQLPVFGQESERRLPTVREREVTERARPGINVVSRAVFGVRPMPRPGGNIAGAAVAEIDVAGTQAAETVAEGEALLPPDWTPAIDDVVGTISEAPPVIAPNAPALTAAPEPEDRPEILSPQVAQAEVTGGGIVAQPLDAPADGHVIIPSPFSPDAAPAAEGATPLPTFDTDAAIAEVELEEPAAQSDPSAEGDVITNRIVSEPLQPFSSGVLQLNPRAAPVVEVAGAPGAVLRGLDKVSGQVRDIELAVGETVDLWRLSVSLGECRYPVQNPSGNAFAWLEIASQSSGDTEFAGWMVAASPALSALDHPRYDVWVIRCNNV
ncbi:MAG: DUF2155 domain-containing protein [Pseudomonadota bacterium]